ncbi:hypothetical protein pdam_00007369 [Pocillopora damicornis]|uniref:BPTI/Kunitz inhibitor domain-containing protein n=1 Tax=Pocillopora damicornis TaxID=46731 RepID=A0A3M6V6C8_POCDA|nr:hypothetical protein pdam_00007369 [Pocillopora damicornis]
METESTSTELGRAGRENISPEVMTFGLTLAKFKRHNRQPNISPYISPTCPMSLHVFLHDSWMFPILASLPKKEKNHTAQHAWLVDTASPRSSKKPGSFWCASGDSQRIEFLVALFHQPCAISAIATQGAVTERSWVSSYLFYGKFDNDPIHLATDDKGNIKEFKGNSDQSSIVRHWLKHQIYATYVALYPTSYVGRMCMSIEIYGCRASDISMLTPFSSKQRQREEFIRCNLTKQPGNCRASSPRWFFNRKTKQCEPFSYGGCNGNLNNFLSEYDCWKGCRGKCKHCCTRAISLNATRDQICGS